MLEQIPTIPWTIFYEKKKSEEFSQNLYNEMIANSTHWELLKEPN